MITKEQVQKIAQLCKLTLTSSEEDKLAVMFSETLKTIEVLNELDTKNTPETYQVTGTSNVFQDGTCAVDTLSKEDALENATDRVKDFFATKAVFER